jgi:hypothetical protein
MLKSAARLMDFVTRVFHYLTDLIALSRREFEHPRHSLQRPLARYAEKPIAVGDRTSGKANYKSGNQRDRNQQ